MKEGTKGKKRQICNLSPKHDEQDIKNFKKQFDVSHNEAEGMLQSYRYLQMRKGRISLELFQENRERRETNKKGRTSNTFDLPELTLAKADKININHERFTQMQNLGKSLNTNMKKETRSSSVAKKNPMLCEENDLAIDMFKKQLWDYKEHFKSVDRNVN